MRNFCAFVSIPNMIKAKVIAVIMNDLFAQKNMTRYGHC